MNEELIGGGPGAGIEEGTPLRKPMTPGCKGCIADGHGDGHRDPVTGHGRKGHTSNPSGRPKGRPNDTTILANQRLKAAADRAAAVIEQGLSSPIDWVRFGAAKLILERTLPKDGVSSDVDTGWLDFLTDKELEQLAALIAKGNERRDRGEVEPEDSGLKLPTFAGIPLPGGGEVIDVTPEGQQAPPEPEQDFEEFGGDE